MQSAATPCASDSSGRFLICADKRNKTILNCFRDRTPRSHTNRSAFRDPIRYRSNHNCTNNIHDADATNNRPEAVVLREAPQMHINRLALLKSSSTHDLRRFLAEAAAVAGKSSSSSAAPSSASSTTSASSSSSSSSVTTAATSHMEPHSFRPLHEVENRVKKLEKELNNQRIYTQSLENKVIELTQKIDELYALKQTSSSDKSKKSSDSYRKKQSLAANQNVVQPSKLVAWMKLSNLWKHRPSIETLKQQNIYNDEPCFDTEIELVLKHEVYKTVPKIIVDCCDLIEEKFRKSGELIEGIYRQCGDYNKIQTLRFRIDAHDYDALRQSKIDVHTLTGVLKLFLREIKSPLIRTNEAKTFIGKPNHWLLMAFPTKIETLKRLIRSLPEVNRDTMKYLFTHFNRLTKVPLQSISAETLSISVTPSIFHTVQQGVHMQDIHVLLKESEVLADCVKIMIDYYSRIFECTAERRQQHLQRRKLRKTLSYPNMIMKHLF